MLKLAGLILTCALVVCLGGCNHLGTGLTTELADEHSDIENPVARWQAYGLKSYTLQQRRECFCIDAGRFFELRVENGELVSVTDLESGEVLPEDRARWFKSVDSLFAFVEAVDTTSVAEFRVSYDPKFGYPSSLYVDFSIFIADEELGFTSRDLQRVDE